MAKTGPKSADRLTTKDFKFAQLILEGIKPEDAALQCGHKAGSAARIAGYRLMEKPSIKNYIDNERLRRLEQIRKETEVDDIWITKQLKEIVDRCMEPQPVMKYNHESGQLEQEIDDRTGRPVFKFDSTGAIKAVENLAKHIGYYELDNKQKRTVIKIGAVQNVANFFFEDEQEPPQEDTTFEIGQ